MIHHFIEETFSPSVQNIVHSQIHTHMKNEEVFNEKYKSVEDALRRIHAETTKSFKENKLEPHMVIAGITKHPEHIFRFGPEMYESELYSLLGIFGAPNWGGRVFSHVSRLCQMFRTQEERQFGAAIIMHINTIRLNAKRLFSELDERKISQVLSGEEHYATKPWWTFGPYVYSHFLHRQRTNSFAALCACILWATESVQYHKEEGTRYILPGMVPEICWGLLLEGKCDERSFAHILAKEFAKECGPVLWETLLPGDRLEILLVESQVFLKNDLELFIKKE